MSVELPAMDFPILDRLRADGPFPASRDQLMLFGQFVGVWDMAVEYYDPAGHRTYQGHWEWSFAWVLGGRAVQDVIVDLGINQWTFSEIRPDPFTWTGLESRQGTDWWV